MLTDNPAILFFSSERNFSKDRQLLRHTSGEDAGERPKVNGGLLIQASATFTAIAAIPRTIPIMPEIPILPVAFLNRNVPATPSRMAPMAKITVRIAHERMPKTRLTIPNHFSGCFDTAPGTGPEAAAATSGWLGAAGTGAGCAAGYGAGTGAGCAAGCAAGCRRIRGFPQFLQNWLESGFWVPHSPQNI
jgi:hypothetical protein